MAVENVTPWAASVLGLGLGLVVVGLLVAAAKRGLSRLNPLLVLMLVVAFVLAPPEAMASVAMVSVGVVLLSVEPAAPPSAGQRAASAWHAPGPEPVSSRFFELDNGRGLVQFSLVDGKLVSRLHRIPV